MIKAIETRYKGYRFRSRLEARWAVFFDALGIEWEYEPEGFDLGPSGWYLPDFYLKKFNGGMFVEVKRPGGDISKPRALCMATKKKVLIADGTPECRQYDVFAQDAGGGVTVIDACFQDKYLTGSNKSEHRMFVFLGSDDDFCPEYNPDIESAVFKARAARFEHGEAP